jgi:hypothetical protein
MTTVWVAFHRGEFFGEAEPPGPPSFVGVYTTREEALKRCWPEGDERWIRQETVSAECHLAEHLREFARNLPESASETYRQAFFDAAELVGDSRAQESTA